MKSEKNENNDAEETYEDFGKYMNEPEEYEL